MTRLGDRRSAAGAGLQIESLRRRNTAAVVETILARGHVARSEIAEQVGLSQTAVTKITADLKKAGLIIEGVPEGLEVVAPAEPTVGRPRVPIRLDRSRYRFAGVHIGLRRSTVALVDLTGAVVGHAEAEHRALDPRSVLAESRDMLKELSSQDGGVVLGAGVSAGGWVDPVSGVLRGHELLGWYDVPLADAVTGLDVPVTVDSSVRAMALAESRFGAGRSCDNLLYLFIGNIVGAAHFLDGTVSSGHQSIAGTVDHFPTDAHGPSCVCGRRNCLSAVASDLATVLRAREAGVLSSQEQYEDLVALAGQNGVESPQARSLLRQRAAWVGGALGVLADLLAPEIIVLGGGLIQLPEALEAVRSAALKRTSRFGDLADRIVVSELGMGARVRGAACLALDAFYQDPLATERHWQLAP